jgi:hypothetical protein
MATYYEQSSVSKSLKAKDWNESPIVNLWREAILWGLAIAIVCL